MKVFKQDSAHGDPFDESRHEEPGAGGDVFQVEFDIFLTRQAQKVGVADQRTHDHDREKGEISGDRKQVAACPFLSTEKGNQAGHGGKRGDGKARRIDESGHAVIGGDPERCQKQAGKQAQKHA